MSATYTAKEGGYAYLYVSNEHPTQVDVYFDDIFMSYTPSRIIQSNEYYPFGAQTARSWTRESAVANNFLGNGGTEYNATSSQYDLDFRNYDPILGRLNQIDPLSNKFGGLSPYHFSFNNPVTWNDPSGAQGEDGYNVPKGPYDAGTPWSHNWMTGRPANQEGHGEVATSLFWRMVADAREARYGGGSMQEYGQKYGLSVPIAKEVRDVKTQDSPFPPSIDLHKRFNESVTKVFMNRIASYFSKPQIDLKALEEEVQIIGNGPFKDDTDAVEYQKIDGFVNPWASPQSIFLVGYDITIRNSDGSVSSNISVPFYDDARHQNYEFELNGFGAPEWQFEFAAGSKTISIIAHYNTHDPR